MSVACRCTNKLHVTASHVLVSQVTLKYVDGEGTEVVRPLAEAKAGPTADGLPVRSFGSYAGMHHYPGWWWSATTASLLPYESLLERDRLLAADFDRDVVAIASQPFGLTARVGGANRHHVPDFLLIGRDGTPTVVDVKPARLAAKPEVLEVLEWTGNLIHQRGWRYEVWSGLTPTLQENLRFIAAGRHANSVDPEALSLLERQEADGRTIGEVRCCGEVVSADGRHGSVRPLDQGHPATAAKGTISWAPT